MVTYISNLSDFNAWDATMTNGLLLNDLHITNDMITKSISKTFDGGGHAIIFENGYTPTNRSFTGLFSVPALATTAIIKNFLVISTEDNILENSNSGWILGVGQMIATISNVEVRDSSTNGGSFVGRFSGGPSFANPLIVTNCKYVGNLPSGYGGILSYNYYYSIVTNCFSDILSSGSSCGGIVGWKGAIDNVINTIVDSCFSRGTLGVGSGGIVGSNNAATVTNCYSTVTLSDNNSAGIIRSGTGTVTNCFYLGSSSGSPGIILGGLSPPVINNCAANIGVCNVAYTGSGVSISDYTETAGTTNAPITSWPTDKWAHINEAGWNQPPLLQAFLTDSWTGYTSYDSVPNLVLPMPCLLKGTLIQTPNGEKLIEDLSPGDIITTSKGTAIINKIHHRISFEEPYLIPAGYYGETPKRDLYISAHHAFLIDHVWYHPKCCGLFKTVNLGKIEYYHIETSDQYNDHLLAEGMTVESFSFSGYPFVCRGNICAGPNPN